MIKFSKSTYENIEGIHILNINEKDNHSAGYAYGKLLVEAKHPIIKFMNRRSIKILSKIVCILTKKQQQKIIFPPEYLEEIRGCSEATGIPAEHILLYNNLFDIVPKYGAHCTTTSFQGNNGNLISRNTDVHPLTKLALKHAETIIVTIKTPGKNKITHASIPLLVGAITGWNEKGISIYSHQISFMDKTCLDKYSTALLVRTALEKSNNIVDVKKFLQKNHSNRPVNILVSDAARKNHCTFEIHPTDFAQITTKEKYLVAATTFNKLTNHYKKRRNTNEFIKRGEMRIKSAEDYVKNKQNITALELVEQLKDTRNGTDVKITGCSMANKGTYQSFVVDMKKNIIHISNGKKAPVATTGEHIKIKLK